VAWIIWLRSFCVALPHEGLCRACWKLTSWAYHRALWLARFRWGWLPMGIGGGVAGLTDVAGVAFLTLQPTQGTDERSGAAEWTYILRSTSS